ncbi:hypothetical protein G5C66_06370 [Nocardioides sp. KC13]|uniref:Uncharacterized protein n=1 Tax=Nocardioides turkmenicus TaxID=2711220 RepID=A0A6M1QX64_9ACTN|nr:hypothetical protein [Nocardioides sp. KC13]NGN92366.1 hypothetical protein [Nocardioides sp. KC13]
MSGTSTAGAKSCCGQNAVAGSDISHEDPASVGTRSTTHMLCLSQSRDVGTKKMLSEGTTITSPARTICPVASRWSTATVTTPRSAAADSSGAHQGMSRSLLRTRLSR